MQTVIETSALHDTACELVYDKNFSVLNNVVDILFHNAVCLDSLIDVVGKSHIISVHKVYNVKRLFCFLNSALCKSCGLSLLVDDIVAVQKVVICLIVHFNNCNRLQGLCKSVGK